MNKLLAVVLAFALVGCATVAPTVPQVRQGSIAHLGVPVTGMDAGACAPDQNYLSVVLADETNLFLGVESGKMVWADLVDGKRWLTFGVFDAKTGAFTLDLKTRHRYLDGMSVCADLFGGDVKLKPSNMPRIDHRNDVKGGA